MRKFMCWLTLKKQASCLNSNDIFASLHGSDEYWMTNGSKLLKERICLFHGKTNPIRCFSANELKSIISASSSSKQSSLIGHYLIDCYCKWYDGVLNDGRRVMIKVVDNFFRFEHEENLREIAVSTEMNSHNNVHKLLGCCLETKHPVLVFEWLENPITLRERMLNSNSNQRGLEWKERLRIAWQISHAISYLHTAFPRPIIHMDIKATNVLLDQKQDNTAKLGGFRLATYIPDGKTYVELSIRGTFGYLDPCYLQSSCANEKVDVYSFGVLLLELLTGQKAYRILDEEEKWICLTEWVRKKETLIDHQQEEAINQIIDPEILTNIATLTTESHHLQHQLLATLNLALSCTADMAENRPTMVEVATQLKSMVDQTRHLESITLDPPPA